MVINADSQQMIEVVMFLRNRKEIRELLKILERSTGPEILS